MRNMTLPANQPPEEAASHSYPAAGQPDYVSPAVSPAVPMQTDSPVAPQPVPGAATSGAPVYTAPSVPMQVPMQRSATEAGYPGQVGPPQGFPVAGGPVPNPMPIGPGPGLVPGSAPPGIPGARRGRAGMVLIAVLLVMVLGMAGWFAAYKINTDEMIAAKDKRIEKLQSDLKDQGDELKTTKDSLTKTKNELKDSYKCADAANDLLLARDEKSAEKAVEEMLKEC